MLTAYPALARDRDRWIVDRRPARFEVDPRRPNSFHSEEERAAAGEVIPVATLFLANRECPYRCLMCDLWRRTLEMSVQPGDIPAQIDYALTQLGPARAIKLYNSGSFFDPRAIPPSDYEPITARLTEFETITVECHPALIGDRCLRFSEMLAGRLEVAMGLETVHPEVLPRLNKRMTLEQVQDAADFLKRNDIALRVFILVKPPFLNEVEALEWACRSIDFAFDCSASVVSLIPTRPGNGALDALMATGDFAPPRIETLEAATAYGVGLQRGRVFADLWDLEPFSNCEACFPARRERLNVMNKSQILVPAPYCGDCDPQISQIDAD